MMVEWRHPHIHMLHAHMHMHMHMHARTQPSLGARYNLHSCQLQLDHHTRITSFQLQRDTFHSRYSMQTIFMHGTGQ